jgi:4'-phosphopantetheinyl transferase
MTRESLDLYLADPDDLLNEELAQACMPLLTEDELQRWRAFKFDRHRREFLATRVLVRTALSQHHPIAARAWRFQRNPYGKPAIDPPCGLRFNLSNSLGLVACLIADGLEVGVDVESYDRSTQVAELAPTVFSPQERAQLDALNASDQLDRALSLWTLKESYIKARGMGLALPLEKFSFLFDFAGQIRLELDPSLGDNSARWSFCLLDRAGHRIALMAEAATPPHLQTWQAQPLLSPPTRLPSAGERWFQTVPTESR